MRDRPLSQDEAAELSAYARKGLAVVDVALDEPPAAIVQAIDAFVRANGGAGDAAAARHAEIVADRIGLAWALGALWGDQLVRANGWHWGLVSDDRNESYAVMSPTRSLALYPANFVQACLEMPGLDFTGILIFNMIAAGSYPETALLYYNVSAKTVRLIP